MIRPGANIAILAATKSIPALEACYSHDGVRIRYKELGAGRPVVMLHGFGGALDTWRFLAEDLERDYRLILVDLKGHGLSDRPRDEKYGLEDHAQIVLGLIRRLGLDRVALVGHSFGAAVALKAALGAQNHSPGTVSGLFLIGGSADARHLPRFLRLLRVPLVGWLSVKLTTATFRTRLMLRRAYYDDRKIEESQVALYARYQAIADTGYAMMATARQLIPEDISELTDGLGRLAIPVVNLWGVHDRVVQRAAAESVCKFVSRCELILLEDVGHIPQEETPEKVIPLLRKFLDDHP